MGIGVFEVAAGGGDKQRIARRKEADKLHAAIYDVRDKHGDFLFAAKDLEGFNDRAKLAFVSICQTIEPHMHARTGVHRRVMKALENEWRHRRAALSDSTISETTDTALANAAGSHLPKMPRTHVTQKGTPVTAKTACYPGCHENEAHAKKFHKKDDETKEAAAPALPRSHGYPSWMDEPDMDAYSYPEVPSEAKHDMFRELMEEAPGGYDTPP